MHLKPAIDLSTVIVSWNTRDLLAQCLMSVASSVSAVRPLRTETVVVDNASTDGSAAMVRQKFPWVRLIENTVNVGFAAANNQAIEQSTGRYVLLLNPDTEVKRQALTALVQFMEAHPEAGAAGSRLLNPDGSLQPSCYPAPTLSRELWRLFHLDVLRPYGRYRMGNWDLNTPREVDVVQGASMILHRRAFDQIGLLDEGYFMYTEEVDLCYRLQQAGWHLYWVPQSKVVHYGGQSTQQVATEMFLHLYKSKVQFFRKHYGGMAAYTYKLILTVASMARLSLSPLALLEQPSRRRHHLSLAQNYGRLLAALLSM